MAKKKTTRSSEPRRSSSRSGRTRDKSVAAAKDKMNAARMALEEAKAEFDELREQAAEKLEDGAVGDVIDETLEFVRRHPGIGVISAAAIGFIVGRAFRRF